MEHWTARWLGREWIAGRYHCADFVAEVLRAEFGIALDLPAAAATREARDRQVETLRGDHAVPTIAPREGDGVLMTEAGSRRRPRYHLGIYVEAGEPHVLHCPAGTGAVLHPVRGIEARGLAVEGFYRWNR
ncbi:MAG: hypothetical protein OXC28_07085 [Defluviicoccus sp.]|nr:hypothetical protein [Defluviicoccus sp.]